MSAAATLAATPAKAKTRSCGVPPVESFERPSADNDICSSNRLIAMPWFMQAKLTVGAPDDPLEHEADRVAEVVIRMPEQVSIARSSPPVVSRASGACAAPRGEAPAAVHDVLAAPGEPLSGSARAFFEPRFGADFSAVRMHTDARAAGTAAALGALAYTVGNHIVLGAGQSGPWDGVAGALYAHELAHVVQQGGAAKNPARCAATATLRRTSGPVLLRAMRKGCLAPSFVVDVATASLFGTLAETLIEMDYLSVMGGTPFADVFLDNPLGPMAYVAFLASHHPTLDKVKLALQTGLSGGVLVPDILDTRSPEFYDVKPNSPDGRVAGRGKLAAIDAFMAFNKLPYGRGSSYTPTPSLPIPLAGSALSAAIVQVAGPAALPPLLACGVPVVTLAPTRTTSGLLVYEVCIEADLDCYLKVMALEAIIAAVILAALATGGASLPETAPAVLPALVPVASANAPPGAGAGAAQAKLAVGDVNDPLEDEADRIAEAVMRMPVTDNSTDHEAVVRRACCADCAEEETVQRYGEHAQVLQFSQSRPPAATLYRQTKPPDAKPSDVKPPVAKPDDDLHIVPAPPAGGTLVYHIPTHLTFTENADYNRYQLMLVVGEKGLTALGAIDTSVGKFTPSFASMILGGAPEPPTDEQREYIGQVAKAVHDGIVEIGATASEFFRDFQRRGVDTANALLDASKERIEKEQQRYGIERTRGLLWDSYSVSRNPETEDLVSAAKTLLDKQQRVAEAKATFEQRDEYGGTLPPGGPPPPASVASLQAAAAALQTAFNDYNMQRRVEEGKHPVLASYSLDPLAGRTAEILRALSSGEQDDLVGTLATEIFKKLDNIEDVREKIDKDPQRIWKLPAIVAATKQLPGIVDYKNASGPYLETFVQLAEDRAEADEAFISTATTVLTLTFALLSAIPTGGLSVGAAAAVTAGADALGIALGANALEAFMFQEAASGTDFDKAKSISQEEPSLFWLAIDLLGAVIAPAEEVYAAAQSAFRRIVGLRRLYYAAKSAGRLTEADELLTRLVKEGDAIGKEPGIGTRLSKQTEQIAAAGAQHSSEIAEIEQNLSKARPSAEPGSITVPIEGETDHFWQRSSDGTWCRFSGSPKFCFSGGSIEGEALEEHLREFQENATARESLRQNIEHSGVPLPLGGEWQAHHVIPWQLRDEPAVVRARQTFGWDMNSIENGVPLPVSAEAAGSLEKAVPYHSGSHADYTSEVWSDLDQLQSRGLKSDNDFYEEFQRLIDRNRKRLITEYRGGNLRGAK